MNNDTSNDNNNNNNNNNAITITTSNNLLESAKNSVVDPLPETVLTTVTTSHIRPQSQTTSADVSSSSPSHSQYLCRLSYPSSSQSSILKIVILASLIAFVIFLIVDSTTTDDDDESQIKKFMTNFLSWMEDHPIEGVFAFIIVKAVATVLFIPGFILAIGCGLGFGSTLPLPPAILLSTLSVFLGASLGSIGAFLLGRYLCRDTLSRRLRRHDAAVAVLEALGGSKGVHIMILLRLSPVIPYNVLSYACGVVETIGGRDFCVGLVGMVPGVVLFCVVGVMGAGWVDGGDGGGDMEEGRGVVGVVSVVAGVVFSLAGVVMMSCYAKRELKEILSAKNDDLENNMGSNHDNEDEKEEEEDYTDNRLDKTLDYRNNETRCQSSTTQTTVSLSCSFSRRGSECGIFSSSLTMPAEVEMVEGDRFQPEQQLATLDEEYQIR